MDWIYLDHNATTPPAAEVVEAMTQVNRTLWANPSSVHRFGQRVRQRLEQARSQVAKLIGCRDRELVFTSGGTESNNLALRGVLADRPTTHRPGDPPRRVLITTRIEHSAIREPADDLAERGVEVVYVPVDRQGRVAPADLAAALDEHAPAGTRVLVSIQWANNETGVIQPIDRLVACCRQHHQHGGARILFHSDATQAVGKIPVNVKQADVDLLTLSAHKFHGPKGAGGLFVRGGVRIRAQQLGGPQERQRRSGTENTAAIVGMGVAAQLAEAFVQHREAIERLAALRDRFEQAICRALPETVINSGEAERLWNTSNLGFVHLEAEAILLGLSERGVCASAGAACSSGSLDPSPVLLAMGVPEPVAHGSVRFSLGRDTTDAQIDRAVPVVLDVVGRLRRTLPVGRGDKVALPQGR